MNTLLNDVYELMKAHPLITGLGIYYAFSAWVDTLDEPTADSSKAYRKLYKFLHTLAGNVKYALSKRLNVVAPDPNAETAPQDPKA